MPCVFWPFSWPNKMSLDHTFGEIQYTEPYIFYTDCATKSFECLDIEHYLENNTSTFTPTLYPDISQTNRVLSETWFKSLLQNTMRSSPISSLSIPCYQMGLSLYLKAIKNNYTKQNWKQQLIQFIGNTTYAMVLFCQLTIIILLC